MNRREFAKGGMAAAALTAFAGCGDAKAEKVKEEKKMAGRTFNELIEARRSVRRYAPGEISREEISAIVAEALNAPSWKNNEETRYHVALGAEAKATLRKDALPPYNASNSANAAALVAVTFKKGLSGFADERPVNGLYGLYGSEQQRPMWLYGSEQYSHPDEACGAVSLGKRFLHHRARFLA